MRSPARIACTKVLDDRPAGTDDGGERAGTRTQDLLIKSQLLYRLSYALASRACLKGQRRRVNRVLRRNQAEACAFMLLSVISYSSLLAYISVN